MSPRAKQFKQYVLRWAKHLGLTHLTWYVDEVKEDSSTGTHADSRFNKRRNCAWIRVYPHGLKQTDKELWNTACHEVCHILTAPAFDMMWSLLKVSEATRELAMTEVESVIDRMSTQLCKHLPLSSYTSTVVVDKVDNVISLETKRSERLSQESRGVAA